MSLVTYNRPLNVYIEWSNGKTETLTGCLEDLVSKVIRRGALQNNAYIEQTDDLICTVLQPQSWDLAAPDEEVCQILFENRENLYDFNIDFLRTLYS